jgi:DNA helicase TIP49 (TBP-interacting protein)
VESPFGFPLDLIDRSVIIMTEEYDGESVKEILKIELERRGWKSQRRP